MRKPNGKTSAPAKVGQVLVVEDDALLALDIQEALCDADATDVHICSTAREALQLLRNERFDAIVLDVHLADSDDGWAIAELLSSIGPKPPRIVFSTGAPGDIPEDIAALGTVLEKPYDPEALLAAVATPMKKGLLSRLRRTRA